MKRNLAAMVLFVILVGTVVLLAPVPTEAGNGPKCHWACDPPFPDPGCGPCQEWVACAPNFKCGCQPIPGCKP